MSKQSMSQALALYNKLAAEQGKEVVTSFKSIAAALAAIKILESKPMNDQSEDFQADETTGAPGLDTPAQGGPKYNSSGKRGPTQGIGKFCKELIAEGKTNAEVLVAVAEQFPTAKTTTNCVAYYRAKMVLAAKAAAVEPVAEEVVEA